MSRTIQLAGGRQVTGWVTTVVVAALLAGGCTGPRGPEGPPGANGDSGAKGVNGDGGASCSVTDNHDGTSTIHCTDGTSATVASGSSGSNGASCTLVNNGNGTRTITCGGGDGGDASTVTVSDATVDYTLLTADEKSQAAMSAVITGVTFPADGRPVVNLKVSERHGYGVKNLAATAVTWRFALLKLVPGLSASTPGVNGSANDTWVSYLAANDHSVASSETAVAANLTDNGDGTYVYRMAKVINGGPTTAGTTYEADKVHRLIVLLYATGNPFTPINLVKEVIPTTGADVTGQNDKVDSTACLECHTSFRAITGGTGEFGSGEFHGGVRYDIKTCVACHNDQRRFSATGTVVTEPAMNPDGTWTGPAGVINDEAVIDLPVFIHKIHMGNKLTLTGGTYAGVPQPYETTYPQDVRNCVKCHRAPAPLADNWKNKISRRACGACHDGHSFSAANPLPPGRSAHGNGLGGPRSDDSQCTVCHTGNLDVPSQHLTVSDPNPNNIYLNPTSGNSNTNAAFVAAAGFVPTGAKVITYDLTSVGLSGQNPQAVFRFMIADPTATPPVAATPVVIPTFVAGTTTELIPGFVGSPSVYFVYALPQDNIMAPADFNVSVNGYIRNIWNGSATGTGAGTLTGPDGSGYYTITLTGVTIPTNATMLSGGIGYTYGLGSAPTFANNTQPFTQINLTAYLYTANASGFSGKGGLIVPPHDVYAVAPGMVGRRAIVDNAKCGGCHVALGVGPDFHAGQRNDAPTCAWCHRPNQTSSGWSANAKDFIHGIHGAEKRTVDFNWHAASPTEGFWKTTYPGVLNRCEMCHLPGSYDFSLASTTTAYPNMLYSTVGVGRYNANPVTNPGGYFSIATAHLPSADNQTDYGFGFSTANINATLPDGISGTQLIGGNTVACTPPAPCVCNTTNPCSVPINAAYTVNNIPVTFSQKIGTVTTACATGTPCTCSTAQPCTGVVAACSPTAPCQAQGTTLVVSPIVAACSACHDSAIAIDHMQTNGGTYYEPRSVAFAKPQKEECLLCHGPGRLASIADRHAILLP